MPSIESWYGEDPRFALALAIREQVFVAEQGVPLSEEIDGKDPQAWHILARVDDRPVGTARLLPGDPVKIGRVAVLPDLRGQSIGRFLMDEAHRLAASFGAKEAVLDAQVQVIPFYERLGYVAEGPEFLDCDIPHRRMRFALDPAAVGR